MRDMVLANLDYVLTNIKKDKEVGSTNTYLDADQIRIGDMTLVKYKDTYMIRTWEKI